MKNGVIQLVKFSFKGCYVHDCIDIQLGKRLRRRRLLLKMTLKQLATVSGTSFQQIQKYECASSRMTASRVWHLAEALEIPVSYFYEGLSQKNETPEGMQASMAREGELQVAA